MRLEALVDRLHVLFQMRSTEKVFRAIVAIVGILVFVHILLVFVQRGFCCEVLAADQTCEFFDLAMNDIDVNF